MDTVCQTDELTSVFLLEETIYDDCCNNSMRRKFIHASSDNCIARVYFGRKCSSTTYASKCYM